MAPIPSRFRALLPTGGVDFGNFTIRTDSADPARWPGSPLIVGVHLLITRTKLGLAIRAVAQDEETARTMGINFNVVVLVTFAHRLRHGGASPA